MATTVLFILYLVSMSCHVIAYYLSVSSMDWGNASNYCQQHCNSELASIHSHQQQDDIIQLINDQYIEYLAGDKYIWMGLYRNLNINNNTMAFQWADNSTLDFGNITNDENIGKYPWRHGDPDPITDGQHCVALDIGSNWSWNDKHCSENNHILCNHCDGIITKYVVNNKYLLHAKAQNICKEIYGTELASIHTDDDQEFAKMLCKESGDNDCWIGLFDELLDRNYSWDDGTTFDFGSKMDGNPPWKPNEPNAASNNDQCGKLDDGADYLWADSGCNIIDRRKFICNMPSEICYQDEWDLIGGSNMNWKWMANSCDVTMESVNGIIINKQWNNKDMLVIEYMFSIYNVTNNGYGGIAIYNRDCNRYHYIVIYPVENVLRFKYNGVDIDTKSLNFTYESGIFYLLRIERLNGSIYNIYINGVQQTIFEDTLTSFFVNTSLSGYIGVKSDNCSITAKSLFVSGEVVYDNTDWYNSCTLYPTYSPTTDPTMNPSIDPTNAPTHYPSYNSTGSPSKSASNLTSIPSESPMDFTTTTSISSLSTILIIMCTIIVVLIFIVCVLTYWKLHKNQNNVTKHMVDPQNSKLANNVVEITEINPKLVSSDDVHHNGGVVDTMTYIGNKDDTNCDQIEGY